MKRDTKQEILNTAKELFNQRGFNVVSTRDIAEALGISKGNLTYYFKKKEDIVEALMEGAGPERVFPRIPATLEELHAFLVHTQNVVQENAFYFWHHAQFSQLSPGIREKQEKIYRENRDVLAQAFALLQGDGMLLPEEIPGEYQQVIDALILSSIYWIPFCKLRQEGRADGFQRYAWTVIYPYLTARGRETLEDTVHPF